MKVAPPAKSRVALITSNVPSLRAYSLGSIGLSELVSEAEKNRLIVTDVEAMRYHYAHTLEEWYYRTMAHQKEITALYDERFFRMWQFYLAGAEAAFRYGGLVNWQLQYVKRRDAIPMTWDYMFEEERRLHQLEEAPAWHLAAE